MIISFLVKRKKTGKQNKKNEFDFTQDAMFLRIRHR